MSNSPERVQVVVVEEQAVCSRCQKPFVRIGLKRGDEVVGVKADPLCIECVKQDQAREAQERAPQKNPLAALERAGINPWRHADSTFDTFDAADSPKALEASAEFAAQVLVADRYKSVRGVFLAGSTGTGKTHLAVAAARVIIAERPDTVLFDRASRLVTDLQDTYGSGKTGRFLDQRERAGVWFLDDLGTEKYTDDALRLLFDLFNAREGKPTFVTSNYEPGQLAGKWRDSDAWARVASRLAQSNFRVVRVGGRDRRFNA